MTTMSKTSGTSEILRGTDAFGLSGDSGRALTDATETWLAAATECQREMMSFMSMRLDKDARTTRDMMGCRNLADATGIQSHWIEETLRDYNSEMVKLMTICTKSVNGGGRAGG